MIGKFFQLQYYLQQDTLPSFKSLICLFSLKKLLKTKFKAYEACKAKGQLFSRHLQDKVLRIGDCWLVIHMIDQRSLELDI